MFKQILTIVAIISIFCSLAVAGDRPEFDCVRGDANNYFNDAIKDMVVDANPWNLASDFTDVLDERFPPFMEMYMEFFTPPVQMTPDICFIGYESAYTQWRRQARYEWQIVLQMDPQSDLDINIVDCVVKHNSKTAFGTNPWEGADQTGRYQMTDGASMFILGSNPRITVEAHPGPYHVFGFTTPFILTNRPQGGLDPTLPLNGLLYTSKALWEESLVVKMPGHEDDGTGSEYPLSAGDMINIKVDIPFSNSVDIRYGEDNICVKYVGIDGTIYTAPDLDEVVQP